MTPLKQLNDFKGLWARGDIQSTPIDHLTQCTNVQFVNKGLATRNSLNIHYTAGNNIVAFFSYSTSVKTVSGSGKYNILYLTDAGALYDAGTSPNTLLTTWTGATDFAAIELFGRVYLSPRNSSGGALSGYNVYYWDGTTFYSAAGTTPSTAITLAQVNPGVVTAGVHLVGVSFLYATGYLSPIGPSPNYITSTGSNDIEITGIPLGGAGVVGRVLVMTLANQTGIFFVPGGTINDNTTTTATINIADTALLSSADYLYDIQTQIISCAAFRFYNDRLMYIAPANLPYSVYASDVGIFDSINIVNNLISTPRDSATNALSTGIIFRDVFYMLKPYGTYSTQDNGGVPGTWSVTLIDSALGGYDDGVSTFSNGLASQDTFDTAFVVHPRGLLLFNGTYSDPPLSWKIDSVWQQLIINTSTVLIAHDVVNKLVYILERLILSGTPAYTMLMMDYKDGLSPQTVKWTQVGFVNGFDPTHITMLLDQSNNYFLAIACGSSVVSDVNLYDLLGASNFDLSSSAIVPYIQTAPISGSEEGSVTCFTGIRLKINGQELISLTLFNEDLSVSVNPIGFNLSNYSGQDLYRGINFVNEKMMLGIEGDNTTLGTFSLSRIDIFGNERYKVRINPFAIISNIISGTGGVIKISAQAHGFSTGNKVNINGITGTTEANGGPFTITVIDANTFSLNGTTFVNIYTGGGKVWRE